MTDKSLDLLQQIAVDIAVIKNRMDNLENVKEKVETITEDLSSVKSQLNVVRWFGGVLGAGVLGMVAKTLIGMR